MQVLEEIKRKHKVEDKEIRVGVVGCWTEGKISFLVYDLVTRLKFKSVGLCSFLTAGKSWSKSEEAIERLEVMLNVSLFHSVSQFAEWLSGSHSVYIENKGICASVFVDDEKAKFDEQTSVVLCNLFPNSVEVKLTTIHGGMSGSQVYSSVGTTREVMPQFYFSKLEL